MAQDFLGHLGGDRFEVYSVGCNVGEEVLNGGRTFEAGAGSVFRILKGRLPAWRNTTTEPVRTLPFITPAGFGGFFEETGVPGTDLSSPPPPPTQGQLQGMVELGTKYDTEHPPVPGW